MLQDAAREMLDNNRTRAMVFAQQQLEQTSEEFFVDAAYKEALDDIGLDSIEAIFRFESGQNLSKSNLASYRSRIRFEAGNPPTTIFLKRYNRPPVSVQLKNWLAHHARRSCACYELEPAIDLASAGINVPKVVAYGQQWAALLEDRSFIATEKIPNAEALERRLPNFITNRKSPNNPPLRRDFIISLADFIRKFHATGYRHRDLYLSHIFHDDNGKFHLIDLARAFQPTVFHERFRIKDIAQLHFSTPAKFFSNTDRLRFYLTYTRHDKLTKQDNKFIRNVVAKAHRMARHDVKHGRTAPFLTAGPTETT